MGIAARRGVDALARVIRVVGLAIVAVLVVHIVLTLLDANPANSFAMFVRDLAAYVDLGLDTLFLPADPKLAVAVNHGVAALLWLVATAVVVRLVERLS